MRNFRPPISIPPAVWYLFNWIVSRLKLRKPRTFSKKQYLGLVKSTQESRLRIRWDLESFAFWYILSRECGWLYLLSSSDKVSVRHHVPRKASHYAIHLPGRWRAWKSIFLFDVFRNIYVGDILVLLICILENHVRALVVYQCLRRVLPNER